MAVPLAISSGRNVVPALHLIAAVAQASPQADGSYLARMDPTVIDAYVAVARERSLLLILDLQIGRGNVVDEVRKIERFLVNPRVHVAIDPES